MMAAARRRLPLTMGEAAAEENGETFRDTLENAHVA
jgi:hypothetical protein